MVNAPYKDAIISFIDGYANGFQSQSFISELIDSGLVITSYDKKRILLDIRLHLVDERLSNINISSFIDYYERNAQLIEDRLLHNSEIARIRCDLETNLITLVQPKTKSNIKYTIRYNNKWMVSDTGFYLETPYVSVDFKFNEKKIRLSTCGIGQDNCTIERFMVLNENYKECFRLAEMFLTNLMTNFEIIKKACELYETEINNLPKIYS